MPTRERWPCERNTTRGLEWVNTATILLVADNVFEFCCSISLQLSIAIYGRAREFT
jgi:hypothetical protein